MSEQKIVDKIAELLERNYGMSKTAWWQNAARNMAEGIVEVLGIEESPRYDTPMIDERTPAPVFRLRGLEQADG